jgi:hypothetical protein
MGWRKVSLSLTDACNPSTASAPDLGAGQHGGRGFPLLPVSSPLRALSRADPSGLGHTATIYSSVQGPPGVETPTVGAPGRGLLRVDEQLPVKLQMGSLQQPLRPGTMLGTSDSYVASTLKMFSSRSYTSLTYKV